MKFKNISAAERGCMMRPVPESVAMAVLADNHTELAELGRKGARERCRRKLARQAKMLAEIMETLEQGNEITCPPLD